MDRSWCPRPRAPENPRSCQAGARRREQRTTFSNGGTEIELERESAVLRCKRIEVVVVLASRAIGVSARCQRVLGTCASVVAAEWVVQMGPGRDRLREMAIDAGNVVARIETVYAGRVLAGRDELPLSSRQVGLSIWCDSGVDSSGSAGTPHRGRQFSFVS